MTRARAFLHGTSTVDSNGRQNQSTIRQSRWTQEPEPEHDPPEPAEAKTKAKSGSVFELPKNKFIRPNVDAESLQLPLVRFPGLKRVEPEREMLCVGWTALCKEIAPDPAPVFAQKDRVPYYISGVLQDAEFINKRLRERRIQAGQSTIGRQRSSAHVASIGPAILLDDDGNVLARVSKLKALGWAAWSTPHTRMGL